MMGEGSNAVQYIPATIAEAAKSAFGILALIIIALSLLALLFFRSDNPKVRLGVFAMLFLGFMVFGAALIFQGKSPNVVNGSTPAPPIDGQKPNPSGTSQTKTPPGPPEKQVPKQKYRESGYIQTTDDKKFHIDKPDYFRRGKELFVTGELHNDYEQDLHGVRITYIVFPTVVRDRSQGKKVSLHFGTLQANEKRDVTRSLGEGATAAPDQFEGWLAPGKKGP